MMRATGFLHARDRRAQRARTAPLAHAAQATWARTRLDFTPLWST